MKATKIRVILSILLKRLQARDLFIYCLAKNQTANIKIWLGTNFTLAFSSTLTFLKNFTIVCTTYNENR